MKKIKYIFLMLALGLLSQSCVQNEDDLFDDSAAQRMNKAVSEYTTLLESSEDGWAMDFYPSDGSMGGYTQTVVFKDGVVSLASEVELSNSSTGEEWPAGTVVKSLYQVKGEQECILTFDSYNLLFHFWSEPRGSSEPSGYESDYEFAFKKVSNDTIIMKGKHYGYRMQLTRLKKPADEYLTDVLAMAEKDKPRIEVIAGGKSFDCMMKDKQFTYTIEKDGEEPEEKTIPYVYTDNGIRLYEPITINGITFQNLILNDDGTLVAVGADVKLPQATAMQLFRAGAATGYFDIDFANDKASMDDNFWTITKQAYDDNYATFLREKIQEMYIGASLATNATYPVCMGWTSYALLIDATYRVQYGMSMNFPSDNEVEFTGLGADINYSFYGYFDPMVNYVLDNSPYTMENAGTNDDPAIKFVSKANPSVWFSLSF